MLELYMFFDYQAALFRYHVFMEISSLTIHRSPFILLKKAVYITAILYGLSLVLSLLDAEAERGASSAFTFILSDALIFLVSFSLEIFSLFIIFLRWVYMTYEIDDAEVTHKKGIIFRSAKSYSLRGVQSVAVRQGFWGSFFAFGDVVLENPLLKEEVALKDISDPETYALALRKAVAALGSSDKASDIIKSKT